MAPKRPAVEVPPPANSSSEEESSEEEIKEQEEPEQEQEEKESESASEEEAEEEEEGEEDEDEDEEEEDEEEGEKASASPPPPPPPPPSSSNKKPSKTKTTVRPQSSSSADGADESEEEESDDSDTENPRKIAAIPDPGVKPLASKPMEETSRSKKTVNVTPVKRTAENDKEKKDSKKAKTDEAATPKKPSFVRIWSEDDEIAILKGLSEYSSKKGSDPFQDMNGFHEFVKKSLRADVSKSQLMDKIRRLKKKFKDNVGKGKNGADPVFTKPHDEKAFVLSKKIWGGEVEKSSGSVETKKANGKTPKSAKSKGSKKTAENPKDEDMRDVPDKEENGLETENNSEDPVCLSQLIKHSRKLGVPGLDESLMKEGMELISRSKKNEWEEKWRSLEVDEIEIFMKRLELIREQAKLSSTVHCVILSTCFSGGGT
ncbi:GLABROUS1 enhancer-binding protein family [Dillenia turbinata]|uniref:GLABROUS1 enhancer-binding protein family n=1 Tax=Dillenia turbinata TaxID=194707 RepID=A0AAN8VE61_9MAGN